MKAIWILICFPLLLNSTYASNCARTNIDAWQAPDPDYRGVDVAISDCRESKFGAKAGLSLFLEKGKVHTGMTFSSRLQYPGYISPFIGLGVLVGGYKEKNQRDPIYSDNGDLYNDTQQPKRYETNHYEAYIFPEVGITLSLDRVGINLAAQKNYNHHRHDSTVVKAGVHFEF